MIAIIETICLTVLMICALLIIPLNPWPGAVAVLLVAALGIVTIYEHRENPR